MRPLLPGSEHGGGRWAQPRALEEAEPVEAQADLFSSFHWQSRGWGPTQPSSHCQDNPSREPQPLTFHSSQPQEHKVPTCIFLPFMIFLNPPFSPTLEAGRGPSAHKAIGLKCGALAKSDCTVAKPDEGQLWWQPNLFG